MLLLILVSFFIILSQNNKDSEWVSVWCVLLFVFTDSNLRFFRFGAGADVQRCVRFGEPPPRCGLQTASRGKLWHLPEPQQEAERFPPQDGHRHGESAALFIWYLYIISYIVPLKYGLFSSFFIFGCSECTSWYTVSNAAASVFLFFSSYSAGQNKEKQEAALLLLHCGPEPYNVKAHPHADQVLLRTAAVNLIDDTAVCVCFVSIRFSNPDTERRTVTSLSAAVLPCDHLCLCGASDPYSCNRWCVFLLSSVGAGHRYVKTHELFGRYEDNGGNQESDKFGSPSTGQLLWPHPG